MMAIDNQQRHHLGGSMGFDHMPYSGPPTFTNPWSSAHSNHNSHLFPSLSTTNLNYDGLSKANSARPNTLSMPCSSLPVSAPSVGSNTYTNMSYPQSELLNSSQDLMNTSRPSYDQTYSSPHPQPLNSYAPAQQSYAPIGSFGQSFTQHQHDSGRRNSQSNTTPIAQSNGTFGDVIDAGRQMVAMSQDMTTPRNIYGPRDDRTTTDGYGFPSSHSGHSSISSASTYPSYYGGSVDSSVTDYSSNSESVDSVNARRLPRPSGLNLPPAPQSMMGQFNSKVSSSTQKKHKCKICPKRFTRPSSLITHMYSHTGEKPFACEIPGCGRNFSVVSNLRRHRKVHKGEHSSDHGSPEGSWASSER